MYESLRNEKCRKQTKNNGLGNVQNKTIIYSNISILDSVRIFEKSKGKSSNK